MDHDNLVALADLFAEFHASQWDDQIEQDFAAGQLDGLIEQAKREIAEGKLLKL